MRIAAENSFVMGINLFGFYSPLLAAHIQERNAKASDQPIPRPLAAGWFIREPLKQTIEQLKMGIHQSLTFVADPDPRKPN